VDPGGPHDDVFAAAPADGPDEPGEPKASWLRGRWLGIVAILLTVLVLTGLGWLLIIDDLGSTLDKDDPLDVGGSCEGVPLRIVDAYTSADVLVPKDLEEAKKAWDEVLARPRWRLELESEYDDPVRQQSDHRTASVERDGDRIEFWQPEWEVREIAERGRLLASGTDSSFWVTTCVDMTRLALFDLSEADCLKRVVDGRKVTITYRSHSSGAGCAATQNVIDHTIVLRDGHLESMEQRLTGQDTTSDDIVRVATPVGLDDPWPWQIVPGWYANLFS
jgi:hypothetical protein